MSVDYPTPSPLSSRRTGSPSDKGQIHIPGAGTLGMWIFLLALSMLFVASLFGYIYIRSLAASQGRPWPPPGFPRLPATLWASTVVILLTSVTIQYAYSGIKQDRRSALIRGLVATFILGFVFLVLQSYNWWEINAALPPEAQHGGSYLGLFYMLTGLHAAHVMGGLIPLGIVLFFARRNRYSANYHPGPRYCAMYWHFLDIVWIVLFTAIYLI